MASPVHGTPVQKHRYGLPWSVLFLLVVGACNTAELQTTGVTGPTVPDPSDPTETDGGRDSIADLDGGTIPTSKNVTIQAQPSDDGAAIEAAIRAAQTSVHMTIYLLTSTSIIDALGDLKAAGKDVKVVLNKSFPPDGGDNTPAFGALQSRGVPVVYAPSAYTFTHAKTILIDGEQLIVMTMNLTKSSASENREFIATDRDPADIADAEQIFAADYAGTSVTVNGNLVVSPQAASPVDARLRLKTLMDSAKTSLDVEVQSLSDDVLTDTIIAAHNAKVAVSVVLSGENGESTPAQKESIAKLKAAGVPLRGVLTPYIHSKAIVVDGSRVFVGSQNFTLTGLLNNREVGIVTDAPGEAAKVRNFIATDFAAGSEF